MEIAFTQQALADLKYWKKVGNKTVQKKISQLLAEMVINLYEGLGKPEALKYNLSGKYSRRINLDHRIVYEVIGETIFINSLKGHY